MKRRRGRGAALDRAVWFSAVGLLVVAVNRAAGPTGVRWLVGAQAVASRMLLPAHLLLPLAVARRQRAPTLLAAGLVAYQVGLSWSARGRARPDPVPPGGPTVRLVSANLLLSNAEVVEAGRRLLGTPVDVLALQELTPEHLVALREDGLLDRFPHAVTQAEPGFHGAGLFSRWPLTDVELVELDGVPLPVATVLTHAGPLRVVVVHAKNPGATGQLRRWQRQLARLGAMASASAVPVVLVGDFNATADHRDFRRLLGVGLRDAWDVAGRGTGASWPAASGLLPLLLRLDHALVGPGIAVLSAVAGDTPGSDHRHLRVELGLAPA